MDILKKAWKFRIKDITPNYISNLQMDSYCNDLQQSAPLLWKILTTCVQLPQAEEENKLKMPDTLAKQCSAQANQFAVRFLVFLWSAGTPCAVMDTLAQLGLSLSFSGTKEVLSVLAESCVTATISAVWCTDIAFGMGYDNLNITTSVHAEQYLGAHPKIENLTACTIYILKNATLDAMQSAPVDYHIQHAAHPTDHTPAEEYPLPVAEINESTVKGNWLNLEDMVKHIQFQPTEISMLKIPMRSVVEERIGDLTPFLHGTPFVGVPRYFHVMLNWLLMMLNIYHGSPIDNGSLAKYINVLGLH
ncbi:hypothetical protein BS47DRAFT_1364141 [Hydnum rufescens UP504]|uniref:Uncharacterized protein n=1 Tax=Hydnum rufescens UP504 TaxID=1448309 RepID=A0A9P6DUW9_9AGAM|nr:hypothetical protein BS47DRAFT_1364141 [Hydnum rufescens UP504]